MNKLISSQRISTTNFLFRSNQQCNITSQLQFRNLQNIKKTKCLASLVEKERLRNLQQEKKIVQNILGPNKYKE